MTITFNSLNENMYKQALLFNRRLFQCRIYFITLFCSLASNIYAQADYAELEWVRKYFGYDTSAYMAKAFTIDEHGNSYVAVDDDYYLRSDSSYHYDYVVVKYNSSGEEELVLRYSPSIDSMNEVTNIAVDKLGNIYVAGYADYGGYYKTLKYLPKGNLQWVATESSGDMFGGSLLPKGLAIDDSGNVYMAAERGQIYKYNSNGEKIWSVLINDGHSTISMALDRNANIYLSRDGRVVKYNTNGVRQWEVSDTLARFGGIILVDGNGSIYICGSDKLSKSTTDGIQKWVDFYAGTYITLDNAENPITFGWYSNGLYDEFATRKFDTNGTKLWEAFYAGPTPGLIYPPRGPTALSTDRFGNIYVTGSSYGGKGTWDITIIKYSPTGEEKWVIRYDNDPVQVDKIPIDVKVDTLGNVYITGSYIANTTRPEVLTLKYRQPNFITSVNLEKISENTFKLFQNYPNPFNPLTTIHFSIPIRSFINLCVYDLLGREVAVLVNEERSSGTYETFFNGTNLSSGVYFYRLRAVPIGRQAGEFVQTRKFVLLK